MASSASCAASGASSHPATPVRSPPTRSRRLTWRRSYVLDPADDLLREISSRHVVLVPPDPLAHGVVTHAVPPAHGTPAHRGDLPLQPRVWRPIHLAPLRPRIRRPGTPRPACRAAVAMGHVSRSECLAASKAVTLTLDAVGPAAVGVERSCAVRAHDPEIVEPVVVVDAVDVIEDQAHRLALPLLALAAELAITRLV